jgi:hypothetical protein
LVDRSFHHLDKLAAAKAEIYVSILLISQDVRVAGRSIFECSVNVAIEDAPSYSLPLNRVDVVLFAAQLVRPLIAQRLICINHLLRKCLRRLHITIMSKVLAHEVLDQNVLIVTRIGRGNIRLTDFIQRSLSVLKNHVVDIECEWLAAKVNSKMFIGPFHPD